MAVETDWVQQVIRAVRPLLPPTFVGQIELNCFLGGISNVNVRQSIKQVSTPQTTGGNDGKS